MRKIIILVFLIILETIIMISFYDTNERINIYWAIIGLILFLNILLGMFWFIRKDGMINGIRIAISSGFYAVILIFIFMFAYYQFNYVVMPYDFYNNDEIFYVNYNYEDLSDDVRIEYYALDYYGIDEIYRESYDKNEIQEFLKLFKDIRLVTEEEYSQIGYQNTNLDWHNDIHVMIRNMDDIDNEDGNSGYYVFSINLVDTSIYAMKNNGASPPQIYLVTEELRQFILNHLY